MLWQLTRRPSFPRASTILTSRRDSPVRTAVIRSARTAAHCMVSTVVGQKCPRCARQSTRARGYPGSLLLLRAFGAGLAVAAVGALVLLKVGLFGGILLAAGYGFLVGEAVRQAARKRVHSRLGAIAAASLVIGLGCIAIVFSIPLLAPQVLLFLAVGGGVAFVRASGIW